MKFNIYILAGLLITATISCKENGNDGNDNTRGDKTFENAVSMAVQVVSKL